MSKGLIIGIVGALLVLLVFFVFRRDKHLWDSLPPRHEVASYAEAVRAANALAGEQPGRVVRRIAGTGSMSYQGYIPAAPEGMDPRTTIVAVFVLDTAAPFADVEQGWVCSFTPEGRDGPVLHQVTDRAGDGSWIMAGNANSRHDGFSWAMTEQTYNGRALAVYVWPLGR